MLTEIFNEGHPFFAMIEDRPTAYPRILPQPVIERLVKMNIRTDDDVTGAPAIEGHRPRLKINCEGEDGIWIYTPSKDCSHDWEIYSDDNGGHYASCSECSTERELTATEITDQRAQQENDDIMWAIGR